jgi:hypothetical protein
MRQVVSVLVSVLMVVIVNADPADASGHGKGRGGGHGTGHGSAGCGCVAVITDSFESLPNQELDDAERDAVIRIRQDEKFARDVYTALGEKWHLRIFDNIARAEQRHMDLVGLLTDRYELGDPFDDDAPGVFRDAELTKLYVELVARGLESESGALQVGATFEDFDLADLDRMIAASDNDDVLLIANNLAKGSRNHLRAFAWVLDRKGYQPYTAVYLSQDRVNEILAAEHERHIVYDASGEAIDGARAGAGAGCGEALRHGGGKGKGTGACKGQGRGQGHGHGSGKGCCHRGEPAPETT